MEKPPKETTLSEHKDVKVEPVVVKPGQMVIDKTDFEKLLGTIKEQNQKIEILFQAADKNRIARAYAGADGESLIKTVKINRFSDNQKLIVRWKLTSNQSEIINGRWIENQATILVFEDGSNLEIPLLDFYRKIDKETKGEIVSRVKKTDEKGKETQMLTLRLKDGKELQIDATFIN